jgi:hypothetical protein
MAYISDELRRLVAKRATHACEYCLIPSSLSFYPHEIDHIISLKHQGKTNASNLAYACWRCNRFKGSDLGSFDPDTGEFAFLFNPRKQVWTDHFRLLEGWIDGQSSEGRVTTLLLRLNADARIRERLRY